MTKAKENQNQNQNPDLKSKKMRNPKAKIISSTEAYDERLSYAAIYGKYRTVAYCRSANKEEEKQHSFEIQKEYYEEFIKKNPRWEFVGIYGDCGRGRISPDGNTGLAKLISDAKSGRFDLVITNPQTYLGRSSYETLRLLEKLNEYDVMVQYELDGEILTSSRIMKMMIESGSDSNDNRYDLSNIWRALEDIED